jgi:molybdopterin-guanine dinucleotide biosynthesis protein A
MAETDLHPEPGLPALYGLVLAGGRSSRLGRDKGSLDYHGLSQVRWALALLEPFCARAFASVRREQAELPVYRGLPLVIDRGGSAGPASGLLEALRRFPSVAWLVVATDMPLLRPALLATLVTRRDPAALATAYRHRDGTPEPLCAIWEPATKARFAEHGGAQGASLRRLLESGPARLLELKNDVALTSVNTDADEARVRLLLADPDAGLM